MTGIAQRVAGGRLAGHGLLAADGAERAEALVAQVREARIETVRVLFPDQHGLLRGKTIVADALPSVLADGMAAPSTLLLKDTSHRTVFPVWSADGEVAGGMRGAGDILMIPDPGSFRVLPWAPTSAWLFCDLAHADGAPLPLATRGLLRAAVERLAARDMALVVGLEVECHVYRVTDARLDHAGATMPGQPVATQNIAQGYQFLTEQRYDEMEAVMESLRRTCLALDLPLRSLEVEMGPSQIELTFAPADPMTHADNMVRLRSAVKAVCQRQGLHATFMCKPRVENGAASGWHLHQSLVDRPTGRNLFQPEKAGLTDSCSGWIAGLLAHARESCLLSTPTVNGYKRYQPHQLAPTLVVWGRDNRGAMIRDLTRPGDPASRIENRIAEPAANPYLFFASQIVSGMAGLDGGLTAPPPVETPYDNGADALPESLLAAVEAFAASPLYRDAFGADFVSYYARIRRAEWERYHQAVSEWEQQEYFNLY